MNIYLNPPRRIILGNGGGGVELWCWEAGIFKIIINEHRIMSYEVGLKLDQKFGIGHPVSYVKILVYEILKEIPK